MADIIVDDEELSNEFKLLESKISGVEKAVAIANNALYFDDSSDYQTALWEILNTLDHEKYKDTDKIIEYIEDN